MNKDDLRNKVSDYYDEKLRLHGTSPNGVDWKDEDSQELRFLQLQEAFELDSNSTLLDYGCGYAALLPYLRKRGWNGKFLGFDWSTDMIAVAEELHGDDQSQFFSDESLLPVCDFVVASGIFNVKLDCKTDAWLGHILSTLDRIDSLATKGFSFNVLTGFSDPGRMRDDLYYADPSFMLSYCMRRYSRWVRLTHDYKLYEFTITVSK